MKKKQKEKNQNDKEKVDLGVLDKWDVLSGGIG